MADHLKIEAGRFNRKTDICWLQPANKYDDVGCEVEAFKKLKIRSKKWYNKSKRYRIKYRIPLNKFKKQLVPIVLLTTEGQSHL